MEVYTTQVVKLLALIMQAQKPLVKYTKVIKRYTKTLRQLNMLKDSQGRKIGTLYVGDKKIDKVYKGTKIIYPDDS